jgi:hypothetical protein
MSDDKQFEHLFYQYLQDAKVNSERDSAEQNLVGSFRSFLTQAFGIKDGDITQERALHMLHLERSGRTDLLFGNLIFEFKRAKILLDKKFHGMWVNQLKDYIIQAQADDKQNYIGLLTDGVRFEAYRLIENDIEQFDSFNLAELEPISAYIHLDAYLYTQTLRPPSPEDVVRRFGSKSPTFNEMQKTLSRLLAKIRHSPKLDMWRVQWARLLSKVYGSDITTDELFIRHTYLAQFARLIGYASLLNRQSDMPDRYEELEAILDGTAFEQFGIGNISENDFYSWVLLPEIRDEALPAFFTLINHLIVYDLKQIDQDLLKQLYQNLVDPSTRHDLGEYYTPDWLAELTLHEIDYNAPKSLYDPACGSGTFLFTAIKRLIKLGLRGEELVKFCMNNVMGTDVHPLAVTIARVNYLLAISKEMQITSAHREGYFIPVYMADAMIKPEQGQSGMSLRLHVNGEHGEAFEIPYESTLDSIKFSDLVNKLESYSEQAHKAKSSPEYAHYFERLLQNTYGLSLEASQIWRQNFILLTDLKSQDRNGIWAYILKNLMRPMIFAQDKFDVIVGNPPWLSYRYIRNANYQQDVKTLYHHYNLIGKKDVKLFTQMDLSTLFFMIARDRYLKVGGTIAFVMPRAVITGAKQHRPFQQMGFSRVLDMEKVAPLFNVPSCVMIQDGELHTNSIPSKSYKAKLPKHEMELDEALPFLIEKESQTNFVDSNIRSPHYHPKFLNGATLVPRTLCFIARPKATLPFSPYVITDPSVVADSHALYKNIQLKGNLESPYIFTTLLSKYLYPFGFQKLNTVALPLVLEDDKLKFIWGMEFVERDTLWAKDWFEAAEAKWNELKKEDSKMTLLERWDYQRTLTNQNIKAPYKLLYNASGTNIAACVMNIPETDLSVYNLPSMGFIIDVKTYYSDMPTLDEAHYLCAILNAPCVNEAIKAYQSQGLFGERDIHRTPFEACAIPPFDPQNADHLELARLSKEAHEATLFIRTAENIKGGIAGLRRLARESAQAQIDMIDKITERILDL